MKKLEIQGIQLAEITLHVGLGTFRNIEVEDLSKHKMDSEEFIISNNAAQKINLGKKNERRICAIGTTVNRALESSFTTNNMVIPFSGWTNKFMFPPYQYKISNCMITNFHLPRSTLLMQVAAFAGHALLMKAYKEAIKKKYKFFTFGDAMLIIP